MARKPFLEINRYGAYTHKTCRTGCPPIRETAASLRSVGTSAGPSGIPSSTEVSTPNRSSSSESDHSCTIPKENISTVLSYHYRCPKSEKHEW